MDDLIQEMIEPPRPAGLDPARRVRLVATTLTIGLAAAGITSLTTSALFTDQATMSATDFTTGTVQIETAESASVTLEDLNLAPGDTTFGVVSVDNSGSLEHRYAVSLTATNDQPQDLAGQLGLRVYAAGPTMAAGDDVTGSCRASGLGDLELLVDVDALPTTTTALIGSTATGHDTTPGGGDRTLSAQATETLCLAVHLPLETGNTFQETSASVELVFDAEQTANNP